MSWVIRNFAELNSFSWRGQRHPCRFDNQVFRYCWQSQWNAIDWFGLVNFSPSRIVIQTWVYFYKPVHEYSTLAIWLEYGLVIEYIYTNINPTKRNIYKDHQLIVCMTLHVIRSFCPPKHSNACTLYIICRVHQTSCWIYLPLCSILFIFCLICHSYRLYANPKMT